MIIFIAGHSYLGKLAASFPNVMLQMQDPNHTLHSNCQCFGSWVTNQEIRKSPPAENLFSFKDPATQLAWRVESLTGGWPHEITHPCIEL